MIWATECNNGAHHGYVAEMPQLGNCANSPRPLYQQCEPKPGHAR